MLSFKTIFIVNLLPFNFISVEQTRIKRRNRVYYSFSWIALNNSPVRGFSIYVQMTGYLLEFSSATYECLL